MKNPNAKNFFGLLNHQNTKARQEASKDKLLVRLSAPNFLIKLMHQKYIPDIKKSTKIHV